MRELALLIWRGLDETLRRELLETVWNGGPRNPELGPLYPVAEDMLQASAERVALEDACAEVCGATAALKD